MAGPGLLADSRRRARPAGRQADQRREERRLVLAARQGGVDAGREPAGQVPVTQRLRRRRRLHPARRPDRRRPGRRRPPTPAPSPACTASSTARWSGRSWPRTGGRSKRSSRSTSARTAGTGPATAVDHLRAIAKSGAGGMTVHIAGPLGSAADSANSFKGIDGTLLLRHAGRRHRAAAHHLPEPDPVAAAGHLGGHRPGHRRGAGVPAGRARRADRQRPDRRASWTCWSSAPAPTTPCC